jgi:hypothetical protein
MRADDRADGLPGEFGSGVYQGDDVHLKTEYKTTAVLVFEFVLLEKQEKIPLEGRRAFDIELVRKE